jgi:hypothetical protein
MDLLVEGEGRMRSKHVVPVWFFVGLLLSIDGAIIFVTGLLELSHPPATVFGEYHAALWWGILLIIIGAFYTYKFWPRKG